MMFKAKRLGGNAGNVIANRLPPNARVSLVAFLLCLLVLVVYWQVRSHAFVSFDDGVYVYKNALVKKGLTTEGVVWAFTTFFSGNWHPLTWLSHMSDVELFGLSAGWHHSVNVVLHLLNTVLLFLVLRQMTGGLWQSAFVAALFGVHPLHVESVAWVAERKDVLSTLFWIVTMGAYLRYVRSPGVGRYLIMAFSFASGLMAKPMLVTLPFVLLALDYWPLERIDLRSPGSLAQRTAEKLPLFAMSAASCVVTYVAQAREGAVKSIETIPFAMRISNAAVSYVQYLGKTIWPASLSVFYPHPASTPAGLPLWLVAGSMALLAATSALALWGARRFRYIATGWLWFVVTLLPVIGLIQIGEQAVADRYTYVPLIGIFILVGWGSVDVLRRWSWHRRVLAPAGCLVIALSVALAHVQTGHWRDSISLFRHAITVTENNWLALNNMGFFYEEYKQYREAIWACGEAVRIRPDYYQAWNNLGFAYANLGMYNEAIDAFATTVRVNPHYGEAWYNLGVVYSIRGQRPELLETYRRLLAVDPALANRLRSFASLE